jgi:hypothetical protein
MVIYGNVMEPIRDGSRGFAKILYILDAFISLANHLGILKILDS